MTHQRPVPGSRRPMLVVEDENVVALLLASRFQRFHTVTSVSTLAEARDVLHQSDWAAVVLDVGLPDGNGLDLLDLVGVAHPGARVLVLTGSLSPDVINRAQLAGAEYAVKPVSAENLDAFARRAAVPHSRSAVSSLVRGVASAHGFSPAETRIVLEMVRGSDRGELPDRLGVAPSTVRTQVRSLLRKCRRADLADLVRAIWQRLARRGHIPLQGG